MSPPSAQSPPGWSAADGSGTAGAAEQLCGDRQRAFRKNLLAQGMEWRLGYGNRTGFLIVQTCSPRLFYAVDVPQTGEPPKRQMFLGFESHELWLIIFPQSTQEFTKFFSPQLSYRNRGPHRPQLFGDAMPKQCSSRMRMSFLGEPMGLPLVGWFSNWGVWRNPFNR